MAYFSGSVHVAVIQWYTYLQEFTSGQACVEFTPEQYQMIYTLLYDGQPLLTSLIQQVKKWTQAEDYCSNYGYSVPHNENCI